MSEQNPTVLALESLFATLYSPPDDLQTAASPASLFFACSSNKKSLLKPLSVNFCQSLAPPAFQQILPTIFDHYILFIELTPDEENVLQLLQTKEALHIDEINSVSGLSSSTVAAAILNLELQGIVQSHPGKMYKLV